MEALHLGVVVLENNLYKALVCCVDHRSVQTRRSVKRSVREVQLISSFHFIAIRKPHWSTWIHKWNPVKCSTKWPVNCCWRQTSQNVCVSYVYLTVVKWSLWIWTSSTGRCVLPAYQKESASLEQNLVVATRGVWTCSQKLLKTNLMAFGWFIADHGLETSVFGTGRGPEAGPLELE